MPYYGSRRMTAQLRLDGYHINRKAVQRHMREMGITAIYPGPNLSRRAHQAAVYPYLLRPITPDHPNHVWAIDITYIRLTGSWMYLVAVIDWFSRYVLAWELSNSLEGSFCCTALERALQQGTPTIFNTDQGSQFTSQSFTTRLQAAGVQVSMDGKGRALDNVIIERFWRNLKYEDVYLKGYTTPCAARQGIGAYMQQYNEIRLHQALAYQTSGRVYRGEVQLSDGKTAECR